MYAVIETGGVQHRIAPGDVIQIQKLPQDGAKEITIDKVLFLERDGTMTVGTPYVPNASVKAEIQGIRKADKVLIFKKKPRKVHKKLRGHRQQHTILKIIDIVYGG